MAGRNFALEKAQREMRESYAELCYHYPQYKIEDFAEGGASEDMPIGDIELLLNFARKQYYQDKLDTLHVMAGAQGKKGYRTVKSNLTKLINRLKGKM